MECPFCEKDSAKVFTRENGTKYCECENCGERFVNGKMMDENLVILKEEVLP